ncbi:MAG: HEAT repeat domain-containing protein [Polyangiaceae bacterium]
MKRFNWYLDPSITDQEEKEVAVRGIVAAGESALEPIRDYCRRAEGLTWPLKALVQIVPSERYVEELLLLLDQFDTEYVRNPEPKVQLLHALESFPREDVRLAVEQFVEDTSEPVRFAAVNATFAMGSAASAEVLTMALEREESLRIKNRIAQGLADSGWTIPEALRDSCGRQLPPGFSLGHSGQVTQRA